MQTEACANATESNMYVVHGIWHRLRVRQVDYYEEAPAAAQCGCPGAFLARHFFVGVFVGLFCSSMRRLRPDGSPAGRRLRVACPPRPLRPPGGSADSPCRQRVACVVSSLSASEDRCMSVSRAHRSVGWASPVHGSGVTPRPLHSASAGGIAIWIASFVERNAAVVPLRVGARSLVCEKKPSPLPAAGGLQT